MEGGGRGKVTEQEAHQRCIVDVNSLGVMCWLGMCLRYREPVATPKVHYSEGLLVRFASYFR